MSATAPSAEAMEATRQAVIVFEALRFCEHSRDSSGPNADWAMGQCFDCWVRYWDAYATSRARSYAIEQLEGVAKNGCHYCAGHWKSLEFAVEPEQQDGRWRHSKAHTDPVYWTDCTACAARDRIRLLRDQGE